MPSASTALCVECALQASKYTCPACKARTCSLACTKQHKDSASAKHPCSTASSASIPSESTSKPRGFASLSSSSHGTPTQAQGRDADAKLAYVPLKDYTESNMIQDYLFLSSISRTTAENGRRIVAMNLLPPPSATDSPQGGAQNKQYSANGGGARLTNQQRQRDQLIKQLHYRRFKVMILPEGMVRRKGNLSGFNPKDKKFGLSVEVKTPARLDKGKGKIGNTHGAAESEESWMLHKQDSERTLCDVLLSELERRSFASRKEALKARELISPKLSSASSKTGSAGPWIISSLVLAKANLPIPSTATLLPPAPAKEGSSQQRQDDVKELYALHTFPKTEWAIVVPALTTD